MQKKKKDLALGFSWTIYNNENLLEDHYCPCKLSSLKEGFMIHLYHL